MARKDISDQQVVWAVSTAKILRDRGIDVWPGELLATVLGQPVKVCYRCLERAFERDFLEYGVSLRSAWLTEKGQNLLAEFYVEQQKLGGSRISWLDPLKVEGGGTGQDLTYDQFIKNLVRQIGTSVDLA